MTEVTLRPLDPRDWSAVRAIYVEGIATGNATFQTEPPDWDAWDASRLPLGRLVAEQGGRILGFAALSPTSTRSAYAGVAEVMVYVGDEARGQGVGRLLMMGLVQAAEGAGIWTLQASVFPENEASIRVHLSVGFREVGRRERIARSHDGRWRDTVFLERRSAVVGTE